MQTDPLYATRPATWRRGLPDAPGPYWLYGVVHHSTAVAARTTPPMHLHFLQVDAYPGPRLLYRTGDRVITPANVTRVWHTPAAVPYPPGDPRNPATRWHPTDPDPATAQLHYTIRVTSPERFTSAYRRALAANPALTPTADLSGMIDTLLRTHGPTTPTAWHHLGLERLDRAATPT